MFNKFLYFFDQKQKRSLTILFCFMAISTILEMIGLGFIFSIVGALNSAEINNNLFINNLINIFKINQNEIFVYLLIIFLTFYIIKIIFLSFYNWFESNFLYSFREFLSSRVFKKYLNQNFSFFYNRNSSEFIRNLMTEVEHFILYLISILKLFLEIIIVLGIFCLLAYIDLKFTVFIIITILFFSCLYFFLFKEKLNAWATQRQSEMQKIIQFMQEGFDGIKIIKLLGREEFFFNKFKTHNVNLRGITIRTYFFQGVPRLLFELIGIFLISFALFIFFSSGKSLNDIVQILTVYIAASFRVLPSTSRIVTSLQHMKLCFPAVDLLFKELKNFKKDEPKIEEKFKFEKNIITRIKKFKHPEPSSFEISDINLDISKGQKIGIIGPSGSGKSTLMEIMMGITKPSNGIVEIDGKSIFLNLKGWQKLIGLVPQKIFILNASLRDNILFGLNKNKYSDNQITSIIKKINLENLYKRLPDGLDGNINENGINLSGGEIQRIGICRALIYDPEILFLDEATSSLDLDTEQQILNELKIFKDKTIISIAHRVNTLKNSDIIYRIENGRLVDQGNFDKFRIK